MQEIKLTQGYVALVDDDDFARVSQHKWTALVCEKVVYAMRRVSGKNIKMHRFILQLTDSRIKVDHKDRDGLNNQKGNLRKATVAQNQRNAGVRSDNSSGFKGVGWHKGKWYVRIHTDSKRLHVGIFSDLMEAAKAYDAAAVKYHGEFASTNF